jgi:hypothetical protein
VIERTDAVRAEQVRVLTAAADRLDALADTAELMDDTDAAFSWRAEASLCRMDAMALLDRPSDPSTAA